MKKTDKQNISKGLMVVSLGCVVLSVFGALGNDLWLASTQWLLVSLILSTWSIYLLVEN